MIAEADPLGGDVTVANNKDHVNLKYDEVQEINVIQTTTTTADNNSHSQSFSTPVFTTQTQVKIYLQKKVETLE